MINLDPDQMKYATFGQLKLLYFSQSVLVVVIAIYTSFNLPLQNLAVFYQYSDHCKSRVIRNLCSIGISIIVGWFSAMMFHHYNIYY